MKNKNRKPKVNIQNKRKKKKFRSVEMDSNGNVLSYIQTINIPSDEEM